MLSVSFLTAQTSDDLYNADTFTWYGLDYTDAYFLTPIDFPDPYDLKSKFRSWNDLIVVEREKYNLNKFFSADVKLNIDMMNQRNDKVKVKLRDRITDDGFKSTHMSPEKVQEIVNSYTTDNDDPGIGLVFIVESLSKPNLQGAYWVTFFDIKSKKVIQTNRYLGKPGGFGLRNYWAKSYYNVMKEAGKDFQ